jgi:FdhD protein
VEAAALEPAVTDRAAIASISRLDRGQRQTDQDLVAVEAPLAVRLTGGGLSSPLALGILMRTPGDDEDLVTGFLVGEGLVRVAGDIVAIARQRDGEADVAVVTMAADVEVEATRARAQVVSSSCGLCGRLELLALDERGGTGLPARPPIRADVLAVMPARLREGQAVFDQTGGLHAAALFTPDGALRVLREDVGRHNAVDKVVGAAARAGWLPATGQILAVSGRVAYEIVQKAAAAGVSGIVAVGAPSSLAIVAARAAGLTLAGFARDGRCNVYAGADRIVD